MNTTLISLEIAVPVTTTLYTVEGKPKITDQVRQKTGQAIINIGNSVQGNTANQNSNNNNQQAQTAQQTNNNQPQQPTQTTQRQAPPAQQTNNNQRAIPQRTGTTQNTQQTNNNQRALPQRTGTTQNTQQRAQNTQQRAQNTQPAQNTQQTNNNQPQQPDQNQSSSGVSINPKRLSKIITTTIAGIGTSVVAESMNEAGMQRIYDKYSTAYVDSMSDDELAQALEKLELLEPEELSVQEGKTL